MTCIIQGTIWPTLWALQVGLHIKFNFLSTWNSVSPWCSGYRYLLGKSEIDGSNPALAFKFQKNVSPLFTRKKSILRGTSVGHFEFYFWRAVSSHLSHHPQEVRLAQCSLYVHKGGLKIIYGHFIKHGKEMSVAYTVTLAQQVWLCRLHPFHTVTMAVCAHILVKAVFVTRRDNFSDNALFRM